MYRTASVEKMKSYILEDVLGNSSLANLEWKVSLERFIGVRRSDGGGFKRSELEKIVFLKESPEREAFSLSPSHICKLNYWGNQYLSSRILFSRNGVLRG